MGTNQPFWRTAIPATHDPGSPLPGNAEHQFGESLEPEAQKKQTRVAGETPALRNQVATQILKAVP
jgi:hypothetical protein